jgi:hypothetical protein
MGTKENQEQDAYYFEMGLTSLFKTLNRIETKLDIIIDKQTYASVDRQDKDKRIKNIMDLLPSDKELKGLECGSMEERQQRQ